MKIMVIMNTNSKQLKILLNSINIIASEDLFIFPSVKSDLARELGISEDCIFYNYKAPIFSEFRKLVDKYLHNCDLIYLDISDMIQAFAFQIEKTYRIICLYRGTVNAVWNMCYQYCFDYDFYYTHTEKYAKTMNREETRIYLFNSLIKLSLSFIVLHEVGHLALGHISKNRELSGKSFLLKFPGEPVTNEYAVELQKLEIEADCFASNALIKTLNEFILSINKKIQGNIGYIEAINFFLFAISTMLIHWKVISKQIAFDDDHPISLERLFAIISVIGTNLYNNPEIMSVYTKYIYSNAMLKNYMESDLMSDLGVYSEKSFELFDADQVLQMKGIGRILAVQAMIMIRTICEIQGVTLPQVLSPQLNLLNKLGY